jgi:hypothetical protein
MNNNTERIAGYLQKEMSAAEQQAFEAELAASAQLREELHAQKQIVKAIMNKNVKNAFSKAIQKRVQLRRAIRLGAVAIGIIAVVAALLLWQNSKRATDPQKIQENTPGSAAVAAGAPTPETFIITNNADTVIETRDGLVVGIPAHAFSTASPATELRIQTALHAYNIVRLGLSTTSNGQLLETGGMFSIEGFDNGRSLSIAKPLRVQVPTHKVNPAMQLFDGVADSSGTINWVNPRPLTQQLRTYDITALDFYPPRYLPTLKALGKNDQNKKYTDSLYYSFAGYMKGETMPVEEKAPPAPPKPIDSLPQEIFTHDTSQQYLDYAEKVFEINPARIQAIWNKQFNNTLLATREFEERLRYMHSICEDGFLELYVQNINRPLYEIDQMAARKGSGAVRQKFLQFAARKNGGVAATDALQKQLNAYFQRQFNAYQAAAMSVRQQHLAELQLLNQVAAGKRTERQTEEMERIQRNFTEEYCANLTEAYRQTGVRRTCNDTLPPATEFYTVPITTPGWKNLDVYVFGATQKRQSLNYTDPVTGKKAQLTYKEAAVEIENAAQFERTVVYLIPKQLSSYQRMPLRQGIYKENLNSLLAYDAVALAYKGTQACLWRQADVQAQTYRITLQPVSETELRSLLNVYESGRQKEMQRAFEYELFEQVEAQRQVQVRKDEEFRLVIARVIFNCGTTAIADSAGKSRNAPMGK